MSPRREGLLLCLGAAAGFSTTGILAKVAYAGHVNLTTLLAGRFILASVLVWTIVAVTHELLPRRRVLAAGFVLGALGYGLQVALLFLSLERIDAALSSLLFFSYPALVTVGALLIRRERVTRRRAIALATALSGVLMVFSSSVGARTDTVGVLLSLAAAAVYALLILLVDALRNDIRPLVLTGLVETGIATTFLVAGLARHDLTLQVNASGWSAIVGLALLASVFPLVAFFAGITRVGPSTASILATVEPALTVVLAAVFLQERLGPRQLLGGALVLAAVLLLQIRRPLRSTPTTTP